MKFRSPTFLYAMGRPQFLLGFGRSGKDDNISDLGSAGIGNGTGRVQCTIGHVFKKGDVVWGVPIQGVANKVKGTGFNQFVDGGYHLKIQIHGVWKSQKKSHSTLRAKRATFTFWVDKSWLKVPRMVHFGEFLKNWSLQSNSVTRQVSFNRKKIDGKCQNSNATFWVIFKQWRTSKTKNFFAKSPQKKSCKKTCKKKAIKRLRKNKASLNNNNQRPSFTTLNRQPYMGRKYTRM